MSDDGPTVGWAEPWPRVPDDDAAWAAFIGSLDRAEVERERMRVLGDLGEERPWSVTDIETRRAHSFMAAEFWRDMHDRGAEATRARQRASAEADVERVVADRAHRTAIARKADRDEALRRMNEVAELDEPDILEALARHERGHHPRGHVA